MRQHPAFALTLLALAASQTFAQQSTEGGGAQVIEVTSRRITERVIDVPLSIRALTGDDLAQRNITNISDLAQYTPGLSYSPDFGRVAERPVIRGISALRPEAPQPVSVFIDGIFVRDGALSLALDDAQRVEVIKGPQSALYGRSTYAGAINYITVKPGNELKGKVSLTAAQADEVTAFGAVTVPLVRDKLSMRFRARSYEFGGQYTNTQTGKKIGDERTEAAGVVFSFTPSANFDALLSLDHAEDTDGYFNATVRPVPTQAGGVVTSQNGGNNVPNGASCNGRTINIVGNNAQGIPSAAVPATATTRLNGWPCGPAVFSGTKVTRNQNDLANYTDPTTGINYGKIEGTNRTTNRTGLTLNYQFGDGYTLTSQTGYTRQQTNVGADQSYNGTRFSIFGTSWLSYNRDKLSYLSQEIRLSSPSEKAFSWLVGAFYYDEEGDGLTADGVIARSGATVVPTALRPTSGSKTTNLSPFARLQYAFSFPLRVSLEGRLNRETVEVVGTPLGTATTTVGTCVAGQVCTVEGKKTFRDFSPRLTLDYKPSRDMLIYGQVASGSKSGGFNTTPGLPDSVFAYDGEDIRAYELGFKATLGGGAVGMSAALFRNDIDGLQLSNLSTVTSPFTGTETTTTIVNNVGKARTQGVELDISARATSWLSLSANYAYTDAKALKGTEITNGTVFGGDQSVAGFTLPRTPKHSAAVSAAVDAPLGASGLFGFGRVDVIYQSRRYAAIQNLIWADPYTHVNLSAGLRAQAWQVKLWVKNATNDDTSLNGFRYVDPGNFRRSAVDFLPRLRQVGVTASLDF